MKLPSLCRAIICLACFFFISIASAQIPAFPGAQGFGANATGGRGGTVYHVTTLADSGTGSFRDAVSQANRIIIFDVGGYINLNSAVSCANNLTIAGQTAPGDGIGIMGHEVSFSVRTNDIVRFVRFRPGSVAASTEDGINVGDATNMIFDHVSIEFAPYNNVDAHGNDTGGNQLTIQNSILADPIGQQFNAHTEALNNTFSWCYDIFSSAHDRNPLAKVNTVFINNVVYNFQAGYTVADTSGNFSHDIISNYFITGPSTTSASDDFFQMDGNQSIYSAGNLLDSDNNGVLGGSSTAPGGVNVLASPWSPVTADIPAFSTVAGYRYDVSAAGALPHDQVDQLVVKDVTSLGTSGRMWDSQTDTGLGNNGYGVINSGIPATDSDGDGMPDYWEKTVGLNYLLNDSMTIASDGYANIEHYLNWLAAPHALTATNTAVDVDLWQYTGGFTNASPVYSVNNGSNGIVSLNGDGHTAHFTPTANYFGLGRFQFSVAASDGSAYTNTVTVAVVSQSQSQTQPANLIWVGDGVTNLWAVAGGTNWFDGTNLVAFNSGDTVTFDDTGTNTPAVNLSGSLSAGTVYVLSEQDYTFGGGGFLAGPTSLFKTGSGQLTLDATNNFTGGTTINEGTIQVGDGVSFNGGLSGNVTNNDTLIYANPGALASSVNVTGSGTLTKNGAGALTLSGTQTYTGLTTINAGALTFSGTLPQGDITNNGSLVLATSGFPTYSNAISGPGGVTMNGSGVLTLAGTNTYTGGTTNAGGSIFIANNNSVGTGPVFYTGGYVFVGNGAVVTNDFTIPGNATSDLSMAGTNNNTGTWAGNVVNLGSSAQWRPGSDGGTLIFTGNALLGARNFIMPRGTLQIASNAVISATGTATALGRDGSNGNRSANVVVRDNAIVTFGVCSMGGGDQGGNITVTIQNNAILSCGANNFDLNNVNRSTAVTTLRLNGGTMIVGGFTKTKTSQTNVIDFNGGVLKAGANNSSFLPLLNFSTNAVQAGGAIIDDGGFAIAIGASLIHDPALGSTPDGGLTKLGSGTLTFGTPQTYTGPTVISNGTLALFSTASVGSIANSTNIFIAGGALLDVSGLSKLTVSGNQTLSGYGSVNGNVVAGSGSTISPGPSIGTLTFSNSLTLASGSTAIFEISKSPLANDSAIIFGALTNGGALIVTNIGGTPFAAGDTFQLFNAASYSGTFSSVQLPALPAGLAWSTNSLDSSGTISVVLNATPVIGSISISGNGLTFSGTGGVANANFILLGSTNIATPLTNWTPLITNQFDSSGNFNFTNPMGSNTPQSFYLLQLQ
ncbi:MAG TPA: autotransporter-associated beta strand repeat-containing protein [Verrucomicrobiae bacterium]|jgi:autotransporter-associated beta strand protein